MCHTYQSSGTPYILHINKTIRFQKNASSFIDSNYESTLGSVINLI